MKHEEDRAFVLPVLDALDPQPEDATRPYVELLYRTQEVLARLLRTPLPWPTSTALEPLPWPEPGTPGEAAIRAAVSHFDARSDDARQAVQALGQRLQVCVDRELLTWTSAPIQPRGPSGEVAGAARPPLAPAATSKE